MTVLNSHSKVDTSKLVCNELGNGSFLSNQLEIFLFSNNKRFEIFFIFLKGFQLMVSTLDDNSLLSDQDTVDAHFGKPSRRKKPSNMGRKELVSV